MEHLDSFREKYFRLESKYDEIQEENKKFLKLQEPSQSQVLKMGIINRISLVIRETNDIETVLSSAFEEIHNLIGSYKTYFSMNEKSSFVIKYAINSKELDVKTDYDEQVLKKIKNKDIVASACIREYQNSKDILSRGVTRVIIPV